MVRDFVYILVILIFAVVVITHTKMSESKLVELEMKLDERDRIIAGYRRWKNSLYDENDSLQMKIDEKDTITYTITADSLEDFFSKRYGEDE